MKMKTQLTLAAVVAAGLLASGCSQQMVGQQVAQQVAPATAAPVVKTIVDCSKCKKPARPAAPRGGNLHTHPAIPGCTKSVRHNHPHPQGGRHSHKYGCKKAAPRRAAPPRKAPVARPAPVQKRVDPNAHTHPAIPNCTNSIRHTHPNGNRPHAHRYSCRKPAAQAPRKPQQRRQSGHFHPAIPGCTDSVRHNHPTARGGAHSHRYSCRRPQTRRPQAPAPRRQYQQVVPVMPKVKAKGTYRGPIKIDGVMQQYQN